MGTGASVPAADLTQKEKAFLHDTVEVAVAQGMEQIRKRRQWQAMGEELLSKLRHRVHNGEEVGVF